MHNAEGFFAHAVAWHWSWTGEVIFNNGRGRKSSTKIFHLLYARQRTSCRSLFSIPIACYYVQLFGMERNGDFIRMELNENVTINMKIISNNICLIKSKWTDGTSPRFFVRKRQSHETFKQSRQHKMPKGIIPKSKAFFFIFYFLKCISKSFPGWPDPPTDRLSMKIIR